MKIRKLVRKKFKFKQPPPKPLDFEKIAKDLVRAANRINAAKDALRKALVPLVGSTVDEWTIQECMDYVDGLLRMEKE